MTSLVLGSPSRERRHVRSSDSRFAAHVITLLFLAWPNHAFAAGPCVDYADFVFDLGGVDTGAPGPVAVSGDFAYVVDVGGLVVVDVSNSSTPQIVRTIPIPARDVEVSGSRAYVSSENAGIFVLDLADPSDPVVLESVPIPGSVDDMAVDGNRVYVGATNGLYIVDPDAPTPILGTLARSSSVWLVDATFPYAYIASSGLHIVDVSQPSAPAIVGTVLSFDFGSFASNGTLLLTLGSQGVRVLDVSNPASPTYLGSLALPGDYHVSVALSGSLAYVAATDAGLQVVDFSDPLQLRRIEELSSPPDLVRYITVGGELVYYTDLSAGLRIADVSNPYPPVLGTVSTPEFASAATIAGSTAYVAEVTSGIQIIDVSDSETPLIRGTLDTPGSAQGIAIVGNHAYVADYTSGLQVVDTSNPTAPTLVGSADTPSRAFDVEVRNGFAYVADLNSGMQVIDVSNPNSPALVTGMPTPGQAVDVTLAGNYAYLACKTGGVQIASLANPSSPALVGGVMVGDAQEIAVLGEFAYVACGSSGFRIVRVTNPAGPVVVGTLPTANPVTGVAVTEDGGVAYLAIQGEGILIVDLVVSNPPTVIGQSFAIPEPSQIALAGNRLCVTSASGLTILPGQCATTTAVYEEPTRRQAGLRAWPNPVGTSTSLQFELANSGNVHLEIFDVAGRRVRALFEGLVTSGPRVVFWDGRDHSGRRVASGSYFARLQTSSGTSTTRVTLLEP